MIGRMNEAAEDLPEQSHSSGIQLRWFVVGCLMLVVAIAFAGWGFWLKTLTEDQRRILLWALPLASGFAVGAFAGSMTVKARHIVPGILISATSGFGVWLLTFFFLFPNRTQGQIDPENLKFSLVTLSGTLTVRVKLRFDLSDPALMGTLRVEDTNGNDHMAAISEVPRDPVYSVQSVDFVPRSDEDGGASNTNGYQKIAEYIIAFSRSYKIRGQNWFLPDDLAKMVCIVLDFWTTATGGNRAGGFTIPEIISASGGSLTIRAEDQNGNIHQLSGPSVDRNTWTSKRGDKEWPGGGPIWYAKTTTFRTSTEFQRVIASHNTN